MTVTGRRHRWRAVLVLAAALSGGCEQQRGGLSQLEAPARVSAGSGETYLTLGAQLLAAREPELAQKAFSASLSHEGISAEALTGMGIAVQQQGMLTHSRRYLEMARERAPESVTANYNLGVVLFLLKEYHRARDAFQAAYALSSGSSEMAERGLNYTNEAIAQIEQTGQPDPAITYRVERLGSSEFRLIHTEQAGSEPAPTDG